MKTTSTLSTSGEVKGRVDNAGVVYIPLNMPFCCFDSCFRGAIHSIVFFLFARRYIERNGNKENKTAS